DASLMFDFGVVEMTRFPVQRAARRHVEVELHCVEPVTDGRPRGLCVCLWLVGFLLLALLCGGDHCLSSVTISIYLYGLTQFAPEELVNWLVEELSGEVPECDLD